MADALDLARPARIHIVGVGGSGMSAIAEVLVGMGHTVSGSDASDSAALERLRGLGVVASVGHAAGNVNGAEAVAVSTAIPAENAEVVAASAAGVPVFRRVDVLSALCSVKRTIAVAGTHGKTTTSAMLSTILLGAGQDPSFVVGGQLRDLGTGARWGEGEWFVVEADESDGTFVQLPAAVAVVTSVEPDHLEHWGGFDPLVAAFDRFLAAAPERVVCGDDPVAAGLAARHGAATYGFGEGNRFRIVSYESGRAGGRFAIDWDGMLTGPVEVPVPGRHNASNGTAALVAAALAGVPPTEGIPALDAFGGIARRFHVRGERDGVTFVDEYAHLPSEVAASLEAARGGGWRRIVCVFQPHRYSRTAALWRDFGPSFAGADVVAVTDVYPAGEPPRPGITGKLVVDAVIDAGPHRRVAWLPTRELQLAFLRRELRPGDLCLTLGAGDLTTLPDALLADRQ